MDIKDYNSRLAQARDQYNEANTKVRNDYAKETDRLKELHEAKEKKQASNYDKSKNALADSQADYINEYSAKTKDTIAERTKAYQESLNARKGEFDQDRTQLRSDFDRRLSELKDTYDTRDKDSEAYSNQRIKSLTDRYETQVGRLNDQFNDDISKISNRSNDAIKENQVASANEKRKLLHDFDIDKREQLKNDSVKNAQITERSGMDLNNLREAQEMQIKQLKDHQNASNGEVHDKKNDELDLMQKNVKALTDEVSTRNQKQRRQSIKENEARKADTEKAYAQDLYQAKREMAEKIKGGDRSDILANKLDQTVDSYEDRIKNIYENLDNEKFSADEQMRRLGHNFSESNKNLKFKNQVLLDQKDKEFKDFREIELASANDKSDKAIDAYKKELRNSEIRNEAQALKDRSYNHKLLTNQRKSFGDTVNTLNEKNRDALTQVHDNFRKEKVDIIEKSKREHHQELVDTKADLKNMMVKKDEVFEERYSQNLKSKESLISQYDKKIDAIMKKNNTEIERITQINEKNRISQENATKRQLEAKERENNLEILKIRNQYDKRLSKSKEMSDKQIEKTVEYYEDLLGRERVDFQDKMQSKLSEIKANFDKLKQQSALEKETMTQQFEDRISELREAHNEALAEKSQEQKSNMFKA